MNILKTGVYSAGTTNIKNPVYNFQFNNRVVIDAVHRFGN